MARFLYPEKPDFAANAAAYQRGLEAGWAHGDDDPSGELYMGAYREGFARGAMLRKNHDHCWRLAYAQDVELASK